ncbi:NAD-dependent epimerase/dehydratase family protein [Streptomyces klenkii]|uniref:NAD-dependent epimerase/dehydratase family protein n=1 Tax=Streptomyces klenkii TaxID=1420899 RepID=UPI0036E3B9C7
MDVLIMGGSHFLGRCVAEEGLRRGWRVSVFNRGRTGVNPEGVTALRGDRTSEEDLKKLAAHGRWDAVVDTSGMTADTVDAATRALGPVASRYVYLSTVSVYAGWPLLPLFEDMPTLAEAEPAAGMPTDVNVPYGEDKAQCEEAAKANIRGALTILRPGVILGPHEYVGRLPWWLRRIAKGGVVLAPGRPEQPIQPVDVRDVAKFACDQAGQASGNTVFNAVAPIGHSTMGDFLAACIEVTGRSDVELKWVDADFLLSRGAKQWTEIPLWRTYPGTWQVSGKRAQDAGLVCRSLTETVADTWAWLSGGNNAVEHERAAAIGLDAAKESALLAEWRATRG